MSVVSKSVTRNMTKETKKPHLAEKSVDSVIAHKEGRKGAVSSIIRDDEYTQGLNTREPTPNLQDQGSRFREVVKVVGMINVESQ